MTQAAYVLQHVSKFCSGEWLMCYMLLLGLTFWQLLLMLLSVFLSGEGQAIPGLIVQLLSGPFSWH